MSDTATSSAGAGVYEVPEELRDFRDLVRRLAQEQIAPRAAEIDEKGEYPWDIRELLASHDVLGLPFSEEYGGTGTGTLMQQMAVEEIAKACASSALILMVQELGTLPIQLFGSDELKQRLLPKCATGEWSPAFALSEPEAGSDPAAMRTTAVQDGDEWVINGSKTYITNGTQADWVCLLVNTSAEGAPHRNKSLVIVPLRDDAGRPMPGVQMAKIRKVGMWCSDTAQIFFDDVRVPQRHRIGDEGMGFIYQMKQFQEERLSAAARRLAAIALIDDTAAYLRQRVAFGKPLLDNQYIQFKLAELKTEIEALRGLVHLATTTYIAGGDVVELASMAKLKAGRLGREVADSCLQYWGGMGFTADNPLSQAYRDGRLTSIGGGADEVMLGIICKLEGTLPKGSH